MHLRSLWVTASCLSVGALLATASLPACSSSDSGSSGTAAGDGGGVNVVVVIDGSAQTCAPGTRSCKSDAIAQQCGVDGQTLTEQPCSTGQRCSNGTCLSDTSPNTCKDGTTALRKNAAGTYDVVTCPAGTACVGTGLCRGAFYVGSSQCSGLQAVASSTDGFTQTLTTCAAGKLCVDTGDTGGAPSAACMDSECIPGQPKNLAFCGNPKAPTMNVGKAVTKCIATPAGYKFVTTLCPGAGLCVPGSKGNNNSNTAPTDASCATNCIPGSSRCAGDATLVCGADGTYAATATACGFGKACLPSPTDPSTAVCGDPACVQSAGACDGNNFRACDATGNLGAAAPCALGICLPSGIGSGGSCATECNAGEERCAGNNSTAFQTCVNGRWSSTSTSCAAGAACTNYATAAGARAKICGADCAPGTMRCTLDDGGVGDTATETCLATGKWGAAAPCAIGRCQRAGNAAACVADCVPGTLVCAGNNTGVPGTPYGAKTSFQSCSAKGLLAGAVTDCAADTFCRTKNGRAIAPAGATNACLSCVGSGIAGANEDGLVDSRCANAAGDTLGNATSQICAANNTWTGGVTTCANGCTGAAPRLGPVAPVCDKTGNGDLKTETYYAAHKRGSCTNTRRNRSAPIACGAVPDCCGSACTFPVPATPAFCDAFLP